MYYISEFGVFELNSKTLIGHEEFLALVIEKGISDIELVILNGSWNLFNLMEIHDKKMDNKKSMVETVCLAIEKGGYSTCLIDIGLIYILLTRCFALSLMRFSVFQFYAEKGFCVRNGRGFGFDYELTPHGQIHGTHFVKICNGGDLTNSQLMLLSRICVNSNKVSLKGDDFNPL